jgi:hypothetical protein
MAVPLSVAGFSDVLDQRFGEILDGLHERPDDKVGMFFREKASSQETERGSALTPMSNFQQFSGSGGTGTIPFDGPDQGYDWNATNIEWSLGIQIERRLWQFDQFDIIDDSFKFLPDSAFETMQIQAAGVAFNDAFSSSSSWFTHTEGVAIYSNSHTTARPGISTSSGFDNLVTAALSPAALTSARTQLRLLRDDAGRRRGPEPNALIVPVDLEDRAMEITKTVRGLDSAEGTINVHDGRFRVIPWQYITDTNDWYLVNLERMKSNLVHYVATEPEYARVEDFDTLIAKYRGYFNHTFARNDWRFGIGAQVS